MAVQEPELKQKTRSLRIRVIDHSKPGEPAVNVKMPIGVVKFGLKIAKAFSPQMKDVDLDWDAIAAMIEEGEIGKLVEVEDGWGRGRADGTARRRGGGQGWRAAGRLLPTGHDRPLPGGAGPGAGGALAMSHPGNLL